MQDILSKHIILHFINLLAFSCKASQLFEKIAKMAIMISYMAIMISSFVIHNFLAHRTAAACIGKGRKTEASPHVHSTRGQSAGLETSSFLLSLIRWVLYQSFYLIPFFFSPEMGIF